MDDEKLKKRKYPEAIAEQNLKARKCVDSHDQRALEGNAFGIEGLFYIPDFVSADEESLLISSVDDCQTEWRTDLKRRVQHYGYLYDYKSKKVDENSKLGDLPPWCDKIIERLQQQKLFHSAPDQLIVNEYQPPSGIAPHIDRTDVFQERVASLSLASDVGFEMIERSSNNARLILLERRSLLVLTGDARYKWKHGIRTRKKDKDVEGFYGQVRDVERKRRISLTFRNLLHSEK